MFTDHEAICPDGQDAAHGGKSPGALDRVGFNALPKGLVDFFRVH